MNWMKFTVLCGVMPLMLIVTASTAHAQIRYPLPYPPQLPDGQSVVTHTEAAFLQPGPNLREGVAIAKTPPTVDFLFYPGQDYPGNPWSFRAVGAVRGEKYYSALCDHLAPAGTAKLFEYDAAAKQFRLLVDTAAFLKSSGAIGPEMKYSPGEVQTRIDWGSDGWLYYGTTRGSTRATTDANGYLGDWVLRTEPASGKTELVCAYPVPKHCILASVVDPQRMMFYGGTADGDYRVKNVMFFALDLKTGKVIKSDTNGFDRYVIFARSTGRLYWDGRKYDPDTNELTTSQAPHVRSATAETPQGIVYGTTHYEAGLWAFDTKTEKLTQIGEGAVGTQGYVASIHADPTGRYLYYVPGAHGGATKDGTPIVQFDLKTGQRKVLCFLHQFFKDKYGYYLDGCFCSVLDPNGEKLYVSWDGWREGQPRGSESAALTVIHIPASERQP
jgi:hypothetical protein